ncbi:MAG: hypothetical protein J0J10_03190 [Bosea sp.]|uniref:hypothetical protein n=1 Tax=Bosea sp. (in: a-proteobacteria) TaxID=1871050 RepID=UPI001ACADABB|nr:hypothetical protein [Bosea sp. (in: a-proteobacteria)]MBN9467758.1 hypothetical protein [Bosea sp. (in: a-proteobacteria)]
MTDLACQRLAAAALGSLLLAATTTPAAAQIRIDRDQTGRTVAIVGLPGSSGCVRGTSIGRVVDRVVEKGELQGFTFNEPPYDDGYINLPAAYDIKDRAAYRRLQAAFDDLFRKGARLKITSVACGAAGRIVKLTSATLLDDMPPRSAAPAAAPAPSPEPRSAEAAGGDGGVKSDDGDDSVLRAPDGPRVEESASATPPRPTPQRPVPTPQPAPQQQAQTKQAGEDEALWDFSTYGRKAKLGIADGNHFATLMLDCVQGSGRTTVLADDPQGKYRRGSRQTFRITAGEDMVAITGKAIYSEMDAAMQIEATIELEPLRDVLSEIARQSRFVIRTPGGSQPVDIRGANIAIPKFLAACSRRR